MTRKAANNRRHGRILLPHGHAFNEQEFTGKGGEIAIVVAPRRTRARSENRLCLSQVLVSRNYKHHQQSLRQNSHQKFLGCRLHMGWWSSVHAAERCASAAPESRSAAEAGGRRLQAVVRRGLLHGYWAYLWLLAGNHKAHDSTSDCAATLTPLVRCAPVSGQSRQMGISW